MRITILGGASFIGYWIKEGFKENNHDTLFQLIDAPRKGMPLIKRYKDNFVSLENISMVEIMDFAPSIIVVNLYDLLSYSSLSFSVDNNNALINSLNQIMEVSLKINCRVLVILNKNIYSKETLLKGKNSYYQTYNTYNTFYYEYLKTFSKVYGSLIKIILLPNIFGLFESPESAVSSLISSIKQDKKVKISNAKREFIHIKKLVPKIISHAQYEINPSIVSFTANNFIEIINLYNIISDALYQKCSVEIFEDNIILDEMVESKEMTVDTIHSEISEDIGYHLSRLKMTLP